MHLDGPPSWRQRGRPQPVDQAQNLSQQSSGDCGYRAAFFKASRNLKWARDNLDGLAGMAEWHRAIYGQDEIFLEYKKIIEIVRQVKLHHRYVT